jgi:hypothetical protein
MRHMETTSAPGNLRTPLPFTSYSDLRSALWRHGLPLTLALIAGAALRLVWLGDTSFLGDQAELLALGRSAADHRALIVTGILSSIGTLNPPISAWLYAPFALLGGPVGASVFTALANILAIGLLYALATRYGGRRAGFVAALLYATASGSVHYSRFIWQQNLMAPVLLLLLGAILAGLVDRRAGWLGWAALFWGVAFQLHPTAVALLAVIAFAIALTWRSLRWRDLAWAAGALLALYAPALVWELISHGYDLSHYLAFGSRTPITDLTALETYNDLISPAAAGSYGPASSYTAVGAALRPLSAIMRALALVSVVWLIATTLMPWLKRRNAPASPRTAMADSRWRIAMTLLLWQALPMLLLIRHNRSVQGHYLLVLLPIVYLTIGLWAAAASRWVESRLADRWEPMTRAGLIAFTLALALAQTIGVTAELSTIHSGVFNGLTLPLHYGIPLSSEQSTLAAAGSAAQRNGATLAIASSIVQQEPYGYLAQTGSTPATVYVSDGCLMVPSRGSASPLVTLALPGTLAAHALPEMGGVKALGALPAQGSPPLTLYQLAPGAGPRGEVIQSGSMSATSPQPIGYSYTHDNSGSAFLTVRWTGDPKLSLSGGQRVSYWYGAAPDGLLVANYIITAQPLDSAGNPLGAPLKANCERLAWAQGLDMLAWLKLPLGQSGNLTTWSVSISGAPLVALRPQIGPLSLETGAVMFAAPQPVAGPDIIRTQPGS